MKTLTHRIPGLVLSDHTFSVPLDHGRADGEQIDELLYGMYGLSEDEIRIVEGRKPAALVIHA